MRQLSLALMLLTAVIIFPAMSNDNAGLDTFRQSTLSFTENMGQWDSTILYRAECDGIIGDQWLLHA